MKLISKLYTGYYTDIDLVISPKSRTRDDKEAENKAMLTRYQSKIGNVSLIFDPTVYLSIKSGIGIRNINGAESNNIQIPLNLIYRFSAGLHNIYDQLGDAKLYHNDNGMLYIDHKKANDIGRRITIFNNILVILPALVPSKDSKYIKGVSMFTNDKLIGYLSHSDVLTVIELIDHFDIMTYNLLSAMVDEIEMLHDKIDYTNSKIDEMNTKLNMLLEMNNVRLASSTQLADKNPMSHSGITSMFNWESAM